MRCKDEGRWAEKFCYEKTTVSELTEKLASKAISNALKNPRTEMKLLEQRITIHLGGLVVAGVAALAALIKIP